MTALVPGAARVAFEATPDDVVLLPGPLALFGLSSSMTLDGLEELGSAPGDYGLQRAVVARVERSEPSVAYVWRSAGPTEADADWLWSPPDHPLSRASPELADQMRGLTAGLAPDEAETAVVRHVASVFRYGHGEGRFTDGADAVPALSCGLTRGSCVDIHTYAVAALRSVGVKAAYVAGVFWPEGADTAADMHCWIVTQVDRGRAWDVSHDLMAARAPRPGFDARPGRRLPFSVGRGQRFAWRGRSVEISHFALPHRLTDDGAVELPTRLTRLF